MLCPCYICSNSYREKGDMPGNIYTANNIPNEFTKDYFTQHLITYIGNKRALLPFIYQAIAFVQRKLNRKKLVSFDGFSGSGVVARLLKEYSCELHVNDLESYSRVLNMCYLTNASDVNHDFLKNTIHNINIRKLTYGAGGFIEQNYAPKDDNNIKQGERAFYTRANARILDNIKAMIFTEIDHAYQHYFLAPLIVEASVHTNTSGVFKAFHKKNGIGHFGGRGEHALTRILGEITLKEPVWSECESEVHIYQNDTNQLVMSNMLPQCDIAYLDPPYNQHPYGSNYFMLNFFTEARTNFAIQHGVSGIAQYWNRSRYNKKQYAESALRELIEHLPAKYVVVSYNDEGIIEARKLQNILKSFGKVHVLEKIYTTYRGARNRKKKNNNVIERLYIIEK